MVPETGFPSQNYTEDFLTCFSKIKISISVGLVILESKVVLETGVPIKTSCRNQKQGFLSCNNESSILQALSKHRSDPGSQSLRIHVDSFGYSSGSSFRPVTLRDV